MSDQPLITMLPDAMDAQCTYSRADNVDWALKLYDKSPLKQRKFSKITQFLDDDLNSQRCLDIGSDNGVISYLLRQRGGEWHSADLIPETVAAIKGLVGNNVEQISGETTPYSAEMFDMVAVVDFLEHIESDEAFINELFRILKPGGTLLINVPSPKEGSLLRKFKNMIGQTDEAHGHVRPGYSINSLRSLLKDKFEIVAYEHYGRVFSELFDTLITFALDLLKGKRGKKGTVLTGTDLKKMEKSFRLYSFIAPVLGVLVKLDSLVPWLHGNMMIVKARKL